MPKKALITGGAGFIGSNFVYKFLDLGYEVFVFEKNEADLWRIEKVKDRIKIYSPNLLDFEELKKNILEIKPDIVLHFAAYGAYQGNQQDIENTININLEGTINLVNACKEAEVKAFINTGSSSEYGIKDKAMKEDDILEANNLYGITKGATTLYCQMMAQKFNFPVVTIRPFSVYGPFEEKERLIPTIITSCLENKSLKLSTPDSVRDFIFIEDLIDGYIKAIENIEKVKGHIFNLGSGKQSTINELVIKIKELTNSSIEPEYGQIKKSQTEPKTWVADISKAKNILGWEPKHSLEDGLKKNIEWFNSNISSYAEK